MDSFGDALRQLRQDRGWSLSQLSSKVNWSKQGIGLIETGERRPTVAFAVACDKVFGTTPILITLCGLTGEDDDVKRRALLTGFTAAVGVGATAAYSALADTIRLDMMKAAGVKDDWDHTIANFQARLHMEPSLTYGDELLASMLTARQQMSEKPSTSTEVASAHLSLLYALWSGYIGNHGTSHAYFRTASLLAEHSGDKNTRIWVAGRIASGGPYQGLTRHATQQHINQALALAGNDNNAGRLEAHAAAVHLAALEGDLPTGRQHVARMYDIADHLTPPAEGPTPLQRAVSFQMYLEGRLGGLFDAEKALVRSDSLLRNLPSWHVEARLYHALAQVRHGNITEGMVNALDAVKSLRYSIRVIRLAVDDILQSLPADRQHSDLAVELMIHGTTGPKPWELIKT